MPATLPLRRQLCQRLAITSLVSPTALELSIRMPPATLIGVLPTAERLVAAEYQYLGTSWYLETKLSPCRIDQPSIPLPEAKKEPTP